MKTQTQIVDAFRKNPRRWLVTGAAGFIGSHLTETLLMLDQKVRGFDDLSTGSKANLLEVRRRVGERRWRRFQWIRGSVVDARMCARACKRMDFVLHQAALGSVSRSIRDPVATHEANVTGFLNLLVAARNAGVRRVVYASSSSVYGDHPALPKREERVGEALSPYAASKRMDEIYASVFAKRYGLECVGLRYFNVFGPRQDPKGPYAAVIPRWIAALQGGRAPEIYGDGRTSRDFCPVANVVQANLLAAGCARRGAINRVYNIALGERTTLRELLELLMKRIKGDSQKPVFRAFRAGDVRHSLADIRAAKRWLGYRPVQTLAQGLDEMLLAQKRNPKSYSIP